MEANRCGCTVNVRLSLTVPNEYRHEIKDRLYIYFQSEQGGNCDVDYARFLKEEANGKLLFRVVFDKQSGVRNVLARPNHHIVVDGHNIALEVQGFQEPRGPSVSSTSEVSPTRPGPRLPNIVTEGDELFGATGGAQVPCDVPSCRAPPGLGIPHLTDSSNRRGSDDMYGKDEHHQAQDFGPRPNATHQPPTWEQKQTVAPKGTSAGGIMKNAAFDSSVSGVNNQQAGRADTSKQDQKLKRQTGAAVRRSGIKKENLQEEPEEDEQMIVVTGLKRTADLESWKQYFADSRKSGGGEIDMFERESKTGAISITFKDPSVTSIVAGKKHEVPGTKLNVKRTTKKKRRPLSIKAQCLFLEGIPDGCLSEHVKLFIENRVSMDEEPTIQYGEKPGTAIITFPRDIPDLEAVIRKISQRKLNNASLKAEKVHHPDAIFVQGFQQDLEVVQWYFDNKQKSGGSGVRNVQPGPRDGQAIVYFEDWRVVEDVLTKSHHKIGGHDLQIEIYYDFLGKLRHIPKPVSVKVQESIMEFLNGKGKNAKKKLQEELNDVKAKLQWPDGSKKSQAKLEPVIDESQHQCSWLNWEKEAVKVVTDFMQGYRTARVQVPQTLWNDAVDSFKKITTTCSMVPEAQFHEVVLIGGQRDVGGTKAIIDDIINKLQKKAEYDAEQAKQDITWDAEKLQLFTLCGIKQQIEKSFPTLKITVFSSYGKTGITLYGIRKTIKQVELNIKRLMDSLEKIEFKAGSIKVQFVQRVPDKIHEVLVSQDIHAACSGSNDKITIHGATSRDVREAQAYIDNEIDEDKIAIKGQSALAVLQGNDGKRLLDSINNQQFVVAYIEIGPRIIQLAGFKKKLDETKKYIINFLKKNVIVQSFIPSSKSKIRLIEQIYDEEFETARRQQQHNLVTIQTQKSGRITGFIIRGNKEGLNAINQLVTSRVEAIKEKQYPVSKTGMARLFREEKGKKFLESVEREFPCVITTDCQAVSGRLPSSLDDRAGVDVDIAMAATGSEVAMTEDELQEKIILQLCAMDMVSLKKASDKLDRFQEEEFLSQNYQDTMGLMDKMTAEHKAELIQIGRKHYVTVKPSKRRAIIHVEGCKDNVKDALLDISQMFTRILKKKKSARFEPPSNWIPMKKGELTRIEKLNAGTAEYTAVETKFRASVGAVINIIEIQRVQNQRLFEQYQTHKAALKIRLKRSNVEKVLFHGTDEQTCNAISRHGFNRSFSGRYAALYGKGTYFAVQAGYSARREFAQPNARGIMHILMTKVLVGDFITGYGGMITLPNNPQSPGELYDSAVDNVNDPSVYVIFHDAQAYPEYIIKFI